MFDIADRVSEPHICSKATAHIMMPMRPAAAHCRDPVAMLLFSRAVIGYRNRRKSKFISIRRLQLAAHPPPCPSWLAHLCEYKPSFLSPGIRPVCRCGSIRHGRAHLPPYSESLITGTGVSYYRYPVQQVPIPSTGIPVAVYNRYRTVQRTRKSRLYDAVLWHRQHEPSRAEQNGWRTVDERVISDRRAGELWRLAPSSPKM